MIKYILLAFLLLNLNLNASDVRLERYANTQEWLNDADTNADSAFNLGVTYHKKIKDYEKAEYWYKKSYSIDKNVEALNNLGYLFDDLKNYKEAIKWYEIGVNTGDKDSAFNLALLYKRKLEDYPNAIKYYKKAYSLRDIEAPYNLAMLYHNILKDYPNAIEWYKKAHSLGQKSAAYNLAILYEDTLKDIPNAIKYYKEAINLGHADAVKNLAYYYRNNGKKILAGAYSISLINVKYTKKRMLGFLKNKLKYTDTELQEAYKLQLKLDIPKHYRGGI